MLGHSGCLNVHLGKPVVKVSIKDFHDIILFDAANQNNNLDYAKTVFAHGSVIPSENSNESNRNVNMQQILMTENSNAKIASFVSISVDPIEAELHS